MDKLQKEGYSKFLKKYFEENRELFSQLSQIQMPQTMIITCSDSRINPALILDAKPGDLFISRNIGNVVPPYQPAKGSTQAAIEYAVNILNIKKIVILGHSNCGACAHMYHEPTEHEPHLHHLQTWLEHIQTAKNAAMLEIHADPEKNIFEITEKQNVIMSLRRLMGYPYIQSRLIHNEIEIEGWWYDIGSGKVEVYDHVTRHFKAAIKEEHL